MARATGSTKTQKKAPKTASQRRATVAGVQQALNDQAAETDARLQSLEASLADTIAELQSLRYEFDTYESADGQATRRSLARLVDAVVVPHITAATDTAAAAIELTRQVESRLATLEHRVLELAQTAAGTAGEHVPAMVVLVDEAGNEEELLAAASPARRTSKPSPVLVASSGAEAEDDEGDSRLLRFPRPIALPVQPPLLLSA